MKLNKVFPVFVALTAIGFMSCQIGDGEQLKNEVMVEQIVDTTTVIDNSDKRILARGCDPQLSEYASKMIPPLIGNPEYVPTTNDADFIEKLKTGKWSLIYFAPGACRYSAAKRQIPGGISETAGWTLEQYRELVYELQGEDVKIVETPDERGAIELLKTALNKSRKVK